MSVGGGRAQNILRRVTSKRDCDLTGIARACAYRDIDAATVSALLSVQCEIKGALVVRESCGQNTCGALDDYLSRTKLFVGKDRKLTVYLDGYRAMI